MKDSIIDEIRAIRHAHAKSFGFDLDAIFKDLKQKEIESKRKTVSLKPKPPGQRSRGQVAI